MRIKRILTILLGVAAVSCGGGGGGDTGATAQPRDGVLKGAVVKGLVKNGLVTIEQFRSGNWTRIDGGAISSTDASGEYAANYSDFQDGAGPVKVCVKGKATGTTMVCDSVAGCGVASGGPSAGDANNNGTYDSGEDVPVGEDFKLCTEVASPPQGANRAPITLYTELVTKRAEQRMVTENATTALANAASQIRSLAGGIDVLTVTPVDLTSTTAVNAASPDALAYSALSSAALATVVSANGSAALNPKAVADFLNGEAGDGTISVSTLNALLDKANAQLSGIGKSDTSGVLATLQAQSDAAEQACGGASSCEVSPTPVSDASASRIDRAKVLVQHLRDVVSGLADLEQPAQNFRAQADMVHSIMVTSDTQPGVYGPLEYTTMEMADVITVADYCLEEFVSGQNAPDDGNVGYVPGDCTADGTLVHNSTADTTPFKAQSFTVKVTKDSANHTVSAVIDDGAGGKGGYEDILVQLALSGPDDVLASPSQTLAVALSGTLETDPGVDPGTGVKFTLPAGTGFTLVKTGATALDDGNGGIDFKKVASMAMTFTNVKVEQVRADSSQAGGAVSFIGSLAAETVRCTRQSCVDRQNAAPGSGPDAGDVTFSPKSFTLAGTFANAENSLTESVTVSVANAASFDPILNDGTSQSTIQTDNFPNATAAISFEAALNGAPSAKVILAGTLNGIFVVGADKIPNATASLQILRNNQLVFRLQASTASNGDVTATLTDSAAASLDVLFPHQADCGQNCDVGDIKVDATHTGDVRTSNGILLFKYDDGTFDSL